MIVDCDRCKVRGDACQDCVITLLLGAPPVGKVGLVPRLQLVDRGEDHKDAQVTGACAYGCTGAERSATGGERSARYVR